MKGSNELHNLLTLFARGPITIMCLSTIFFARKDVIFPSSELRKARRAIPTADGDAIVGEEFESDY